MLKKMKHLTNYGRILIPKSCGERQMYRLDCRFRFTEDVLIKFNEIYFHKAFRIVFRVPSHCYEVSILKISTLCRPWNGVLLMIFY